MCRSGGIRAMKADAAMPATHAASGGPLAPGRHDLAIAELSAPVLEALHQAPMPFLASLGFCTIYDHPPAQRAVIDVDESCRIVRAFFYRPRTAFRLPRGLEFVVLPAVAHAQVLSILSSRGAHVAMVHRLESPQNRAPAAPLSHPRIQTTHDVIAELPSDKHAYLQSLGKHKRERLPQYWRRLQREYRDQARIVVEHGAQIKIDDVLELVAFNQTRMEQVGKDNSTAAEAERQRRRWPLARAHGLLCKMVVDGRMLGGTFNYIYGDEAFLITIAHDPALERLNIGTLSLWKTFEHLIDRDIKRYHLFWGRKKYKNEFGGVDHPVELSIVSNHAWLARLWKANLVLKRQVPRGLRWVRSKLRRSSDST